MGGLLGEEEGSEALLVGGRDEDAAFTMLGARAAVEADSGSSGYVTYLRHQFVPSWREGHLEGVLSGRDEEVGVLKSGYLQCVRVER